MIYYDLNINDNNGSENYLRYLQLAHTVQVQGKWNKKWRWMCVFCVPVIRHWEVLRWFRGGDILGHSPGPGDATNNPKQGWWEHMQSTCAAELKKN